MSSTESCQTLLGFVHLSIGLVKWRDRCNFRVCGHVVMEDCDVGGARGDLRRISRKMLGAMFRMTVKLEWSLDRNLVQVQTMMQMWKVEIGAL